MPDDHRSVARALYDRAAAALAAGLADGEFRLELVSQAGSLHPPHRAYTGYGWEAVPVNVPPPEDGPNREHYVRGLYLVATMLGRLTEPDFTGRGVLTVAGSNGRLRKPNARATLDFQCDSSVACLSEAC